MRTKSWVLGLIAASGVAMGQTAGPAPLEADMVMTGGEIYTPSGFVEAMAIRRGVIIALGTNTAINAHKAAKTQVIDLKGAAVVPGLHDMHVHPLMSGLQAEYSCNFPQGSNPQQVLDTIRTRSQRAAMGEAPRSSVVICTRGSASSRIASRSASMVCRLTAIPPPWWSRTKTELTLTKRAHEAC